MDRRIAMLDFFVQVNTIKPIWRPDYRNTKRSILSRQSDSIPML
jgi:hypothetical protein